MPNLTLAESKRRNRLDCVSLCIETADCGSVNFRSETGTCQLGHYYESRFMTNLSDDVGWQHASKTFYFLQNFT